MRSKRWIAAIAALAVAVAPAAAVSVRENWRAVEDNPDAHEGLEHSPDGQFVYASGDPFGSDEPVSEDFIETFAYFADTGDLAWHESFDNDTEKRSQPDDLAADDGRVYVSGREGANDRVVVLARDGTTGSLAWSELLAVGDIGEAVSTRIAASANGSNVYVAARDAVRNVWVGAFDKADGSLEWTTYFDDLDGLTPPVLTLDEDAGAVYVGFMDGQLTVASLNASTGSQNWASSLDASDAEDLVVGENSGDVYLAGERNLAATGDDMLVGRVDAATGGIAWTGTFDNEGDERGASVDVREEGLWVYVTGSTDANDDGDILTVAFETDTGTPSWWRVYDGPATEASGSADFGTVVEVTPDGNSVLVAGTSQGVDVDGEIVTIRHSGTGELFWTERASPSDAPADARGLSIHPGGETVTVGGTWGDGIITLDYEIEL